MASAGALLREIRARRGVSLDEVARLTRVAPRYLVALENDALSDLPAPVFIRGFIRAYCQALDESPEEALSLFDAHAGVAPRVPARVAPVTRARPVEPRTRGTLVVSFLLFVILGMALFTVALVIRPGDRLERAGTDVRPAPSAGPVAGSGAGQPSQDDPAGARVAVPERRGESSTAPRPGSAGPSASPSSPPPARSAPPSAAPAAAPPATTSAEPAAPRPPALPNIERAIGEVTAPYRLIARTNEATWIRVRTGDGRSSDETVPAGEIREWVSDRPFVLTVGNAGGVSLELNGRALPPLGPSGAVIQRLVLPPESR